MAKLTRNKSSTQFIIPREVCKKYGLRPGDVVDLEEKPTGIMIKKNASSFLSFSVWSIGYEGRTVESFVDRLTKADIEQVIDVREIALSRKNGFSKGALKEGLESAGIEYKHMPKLGSPTGMRNGLKNGNSINEFMAEYSAYLETEGDEFDLFKESVMARLTVIMCFERDPMICHRRILADKLRESGFQVIHL